MAIKPEKSKLNDAADLYKAQKYAEAMTIYSELADKGSVESQRFLGWMYFRGDGVNVDKLKALHWLSKAANQNDLEAMFGVARVYMSNGDFENAFNWYQISAKKDFLPSTYWLGRFYREGIFVQSNQLEAIKQFEKGSKQGHLHSMRELAVMKIRRKEIIGGLILFAKFIVHTIIQGTKDPFDHKGMI